MPAGLRERKPARPGVDVPGLGSAGRHFHDTVVTFLLEAEADEAAQGPARAGRMVARHRSTDYYGQIRLT